MRNFGRQPGPPPTRTSPHPDRPLTLWAPTFSKPGPLTLLALPTYSLFGYLRLAPALYPK